MNESPRFVASSTSVLRPGAIILLAALSITAQSRIVKPGQQSNSNQGKRAPIATLRSSDSSEGSRVAITSNQSLNNYEAYRRGDNFYVKIPASEVPRAEAVRGRGFAEVKAQRSGDSTVLSFRLHPGAKAHVEQRANKLDVVVTVPPGSTGMGSSRPRESARPNLPESVRSTDVSRRGASPTNVNRNESSRVGSPSLGQPTLNSNKKTGSAGSATAPPSRATPTPAITPSPKASPSSRPGASPTAPKPVTARMSPTASPVVGANQPRGSFWSRMKERADYWLLLAQLNPIPVAVGAALLLLIIGFWLFQRRRAKATRRSKPIAAASRKAAVVSVADVPLTTAPETHLQPEVAVPIAASAASAASDSEEMSHEVPAVAAAPVASPTDDARRERVNRVAAEAKKLFEGADYDQEIIGSEDRDTRRLVGAELLSALVGRNPERRERAREAFMKYSYFDDATRDLRIAESDNERAAAARRLSFIHDREATPHLIGALSDPAPDVRRAAVEALMDLRDPAAIGPLNALMQTESDRKVSRTLIKHAIEACATSIPEQAAPALASQPLSHAAPQPTDTEREVIEL